MFARFGVSTSVAKLNWISGRSHCPRLASFRSRDLSRRSYVSNTKESRRAPRPQPEALPYEANLHGDLEGEREELVEVNKHYVL